MGAGVVAGARRACTATRATSALGTCRCGCGASSCGQAPAPENNPSQQHHRTPPRTTSPSLNLIRCVRAERPDSRKGADNGATRWKAARLEHNERALPSISVLEASSADDREGNAWRAEIAQIHSAGATAMALEVAAQRAGEHEGRFADGLSGKEAAAVACRCRRDTAPPCASREGCWCRPWRDGAAEQNGSRKLTTR